MKKISFVLLLLISPICFAHLTTTQTNTENTLAPMLKKVMPTIVNVYVGRKVQFKKFASLFSKSMPLPPLAVHSAAVGSGVIFNAKQGLIVTNAHVVAHQKFIIVTLNNGERYHAKLVAKSRGYDIAILKIKATHLTALPFANSHNVKVGDFVTAIGSPYDLSQTVTSGVVSALNRTHPKIENYQNFIQTDAPINPGNSGGALVNSSGELIGINTAIVAPMDASIGLGFAIPSSMVHAVITQLLQWGKVKHGVLGVIVQNLTPGITKALGIEKIHGALITQVLPNTPAQQAGLKPREVITEINDSPIYGAVQLRNLMGLTPPKASIKITYSEDGHLKTTSAIVASAKTIHQKTVPYFAGMRLQNSNALEVNGKTIRGVLVKHVSPSSVGALSGLASGDIITQINSHAVDSLQAAKKLSAKQTKPLFLTVFRHSAVVYVVLRKK